jgi:uncharacterized membrane protein
MFAPLAVLLALLLFIVACVLPIVSFARTRWLTTELEGLRDRLDQVERDVRRTKQRTPQAPTPAEAAAAPGVPVARRLFDAPTAPGGEPLVARREEAAAAPRAEPAAGPAMTAAAPSVALPIGADALSASPSVKTAAEPARSPESADTLETRIGGRWLLYIGMATLVLGVGFFVKFAFDNNWITETGRVLAGAALGLVMVAGGHRVARRGYPLYGQVLAGGGFAALYIATYAALSFYGLIAREAAFGLMLLITAGAAAAADFHRSQGLAFFAVAGGFATPFLVGGDRDAQVVLLTYNAVLVAGTMALSYRREWPLLNLASYALVFFTFMTWASEYHTPAKYLTTEMFLTVFCVMFLFIAARTRRFVTPVAGVVGFILLTAPAVYHAASLANLASHSLPLLVYLTLFSLAGVLASVKLDLPWLRLAIFVFTVPVLLEWMATKGGPGWRLASVAVVMAIYGMHAVALGERLSRVPNSWKKADLALFHANALALFAGLYLIVDQMAPAWTPALALGLGVWHVAAARSVRALSGEAALNAFALAFAMLGFAIGLQFDDWWAVVGWVIESAAVVWIGLKSRREWMRLGGALLLAGSLVRLFTLGFFETPAGFGVVFNPRVGATLVIVAVLYALALIHQRGGRHLDDRAAPEIALSVVAANVLTILLISTEISFYWSVRETTDAAADLARMASLSVAWGVYGVALIVVGIVRRYAPIRYLAIALLALTIGKLFLVDLATLGGIYRIIGFIGLGVFLLLGAWLYQRYRDIILGRD